MLIVEQVMNIKILYGQGWSIRRIAKELGISRNTVKKYIQSAISEPCYSPRATKPKKLEPFYAYLKQRVKAAHPNWIPATVLYNEIKELGYQGKVSNLRAYLRSLKPAVTPEVVLRFETPPGKQMQVDWAEFRRGPERLSAFIATLGFSRMSYVEFVQEQKVDTLLACLCNAFEFFNGVTQQILFDNMKTVVITRNYYGEGLHRFHAKLWDFAKHYGFVPKLCAPYRAQTKGKVERFIGYLRRSFYVPLKALLAQANMPVDMNTANQEVRKWLQHHANQRLHATTQKRPIEQWQIEKESLTKAITPYPLSKPNNTQALLIKPQQLSILNEHATERLQHDLDIYQQLLH